MDRMAPSAVPVTVSASDCLAALEELRQEGVEEGRQEGRWEGILEGIRATVRTCRNFNISEADTVRNIMNEFSLSQEEAVNYVKKYW